MCVVRPLALIECRNFYFDAVRRSCRPCPFVRSWKWGRIEITKHNDWLWNASKYQNKNIALINLKNKSKTIVSRRRILIRYRIWRDQPTATLRQMCICICATHDNNNKPYCIPYAFTYHLFVYDRRDRLAQRNRNSTNENECFCCLIWIYFNFYDQFCLCYRFAFE